MVEYGDAGPSKKGMGDPITVDTQGRPVTASLEKWAAELAADDAKRALAESMIERLEGPDLAAWQWPADALWAPLEAAGSVPPKPPRNSYTLQRRIMLALKKDIHSRPHGRLV